MWRYHAVIHGDRPGIFEDPYSASAQVQGYSSNQNLKFNDYSAAQAYFNNHPSSFFRAYTNQWYTLYFDGASQNNGSMYSEAGIGASLVDSNGNEVGSISAYIGQGYTSNYAEYKALIHGLAAAKRIGVDYIQICGDSSLVVNQVRGNYQVRNPVLQNLYGDVMSLLQRFRDYEIQHIFRQNNVRGDELANDGVEGYQTMGLNTPRGLVYYDLP